MVLVGGLVLGIVTREFDRVYDRERENSVTTRVTLGNLVKTGKGSNVAMVMLLMMVMMGQIKTNRGKKIG